MNIKEIQDLILTMDKTSIENVDIEDANFKISISKNSKVEILTNNIASNSPREIDTIVQDHKPVSNKSQSLDLETSELEDTNEEIEDSSNMFVVKSPIVGTYYDAASPDSDPYVSVGGKIKEGDTLCIIEAMKIMNEIESEISGEIYEILVKNEDVVEYNQPLMIIRR